MAAFRHAQTGDGPKAGQWEVIGRIAMTTGRAILVDDGRTTAWLPLSKCTVERLRDGRSAVTMPDWLKRKAGFA